MAAASLEDKKASSKDGSNAEDLEDGEIKEGGDDEEDEAEDDGRVKTVFDDARRFNVKVRLFPRARQRSSLRCSKQEKQF